MSFGIFLRQKLVEVVKSASTVVSESKVNKVVKEVKGEWVPKVGDLVVAKGGYKINTSEVDWEGIVTDISKSSSVYFYAQGIGSSSRGVMVSPSGETCYMLHTCNFELKKPAHAKEQPPPWVEPTKKQVEPEPKTDYHVCKHGRTFGVDFDARADVCYRKCHYKNHEACKDAYWKLKKEEEKEPEKKHKCCAGGTFGADFENYGICYERCSPATYAACEEEFAGSCGGKNLKKGTKSKENKPKQQKGNKFIKLSEPVYNSSIGVVTFFVEEQSHTCEDFGNSYGGRRFVASDGYELRSARQPGVYDKDHYVYLRGGNNTWDLSKITVSESEYKRIVNAVTEYNEYYLVNK